LEIDVRKVALKHALANAVKFGGKARLDAVTSKIFAEIPELRRNAKEVVDIVRQVVDEVNSMDKDQQARLLAEIWPEALTAEKTCRGETSPSPCQEPMNLEAEW
jgi:glutamyl-tRNA synthetase